MQVPLGDGYPNSITSGPLTFDPTAIDHEGLVRLVPKSAGFALFTAENTVHTLTGLL